MSTWNTPLDVRLNQLQLHYIIAGDSTTFTWGDSNCPSTLWSASFSLVGPSVYSVTGSHNTDGSFTVKLSPIQTAVLAPGIYNWALRINNATDAYSIQAGVVEVRPNPATAQPQQLMAQTMLDLIERALQNQLTDGDALQAMSISGRSLTNISRQELLHERAYWMNELRKYKAVSKGASELSGIRIDSWRL